MSERTIPLRLADQAVAACEAEIQKLREENARLREAGRAIYGIAVNAGPGEGRVEKLDAWRRAAKEGQS